MHVHLRGRQADATFGVHGLQHVGHQGADALVDGGHGAGHGVQAGVGVGEDGKQGHGTVRELLSGLGGRSQALTVSLRHQGFSCKICGS
jgi:hypothetical protein